MSFKFDFEMESARTFVLSYLFVGFEHLWIYSERLKTNRFEKTIDYVCGFGMLHDSVEYFIRFFMLPCDMLLYGKSGVLIYLWLILKVLKY